MQVGMYLMIFSKILWCCMSSSLVSINGNSLTSLLVTADKYLGKDETKTLRKWEYNSMNLPYESSLFTAMASQSYASMAEVKLWQDLLSNLEMLAMQPFNTMLKCRREMASLWEWGRPTLAVKVLIWRESFCHWLVKSLERLKVLYLLCPTSQELPWHMQSTSFLKRRCLQLELGPSQNFHWSWSSCYSWRLRR